jgi:phage-related protein
MKFINTQLSVTGIKDFYTGNSYSKYDLVDYEYYTGNSVYPTDASGLFAWFNLDDENNLVYNVSGKVSTWYNSAPGFKTQNLSNPTSIECPTFDIFSKELAFRGTSNPLIYNQLYLSDFTGVQTGTTTGIDRCWFLVFSFDSLKNSSSTNQYSAFANYSTIIDTDFNNANNSSGYLSVYGNNGSNSSQQFIINGTGNVSISPVPTENSSYSSAKMVGRKNIISILKNNTTNNLRLRNNGYEVLNTTTTAFFHTGCLDLEIGVSAKSHGSFSYLYDYDFSNICYFEILGYSKVPSDEEILGIEKYLFLKNFTNEDGIYIAKNNFSSFDYRYSPINIVGSQFLDQDPDSLFKKTYGCSARFSLKAKKTNYGDGYYSNIISNINALVGEFDISYQGLTDKQANSLIGFFQSTFERDPVLIYDSYKSVDIDLFFPYKNNSKVYFQSIDHQSPEPDLNNVTIKCRCPYDSSLNYKGVFVSEENTFKNFDVSKLTFNKDDVVYVADYGYYWFTGNNNTTLKGQNEYPTGDNSLFTQKFYFSPDLDYSIPSSPRYLINELESSAPVFEQDGINKNILEISFSFSNRSDKETSAILKYLDSKLGFQIFEIDLPQPYNKKIDVYCPEWQHTYKYKNCHDITVKLLEFKNPPTNDVYFNTIVQL